MGPRGSRFRRGRRRGLMVGAAIGSASARRNNQSQADDGSVEPASSQDSQVEELEKMARLKEEGILTEEEFQAKKRQILGL